MTPSLLAILWGFLLVRYGWMELTDRLITARVAKGKQVIYKTNIQAPQKAREQGRLVMTYFLDGAMFTAFAVMGLINFTHDVAIWDVLKMCLVHFAIYEVIYYWAHRMMHWAPIYHFFHAFHHKSLVVRPNTAMTFDVQERLMLTVLFFGLFAALDHFVFGTGVSILGFFLYIGVHDTLNFLGHYNTEVLPRWYVKNKWLNWMFYSPTFHALHHSRYTKNYGLFTPWCDILFGTKSDETEPLAEMAIIGKGPQRPSSRA
jgi:sterol desaturase/sphingolipid hydroxylase (fatty acid hydroxylase superfamily)